MNQMELIPRADGLSKNGSQFIKIISEFQNS